MNVVDIHVETYRLRQVALIYARHPGSDLGQIKKVERIHLFCPKSTMNLTYLCYGRVKYMFIKDFKTNILD
ncbi:MAG: hypothetical protein CL868_07390 [Cytophagaceae bacterium]|nr:hypothetical protein [Cytophagaceae bacterium]